MPNNSRDALQWAGERRSVTLPADQRPILMVVVDTEEDFDWNKPFDSNNTSVASMANIGAFQELCQAHELRPTYVIDYPIVDQEEGRRLLLEYSKAGRAEIGTHLHPWVSPPIEEEVNSYHSYPGNLPGDLERRKLTHITERIEKEFGFRPTMYKAGRYGYGPNTTQILQDLGYNIDLSFCGPFDFSADGGPDYSRFTSMASWITDDLLSLPATGGFASFLGHNTARAIFSRATAPSMQWARGQGILSRLRLIDRIQLSPEGHELKDLKNLTRHLLGQGERIFTLTLHSPSLSAGNTVYVETQADLTRFMDTLKGYFDHFFGTLGGIPATPNEVRSQLLSQTQT